MILSRLGNPGDSKDIQCLAPMQKTYGINGVLQNTTLLQRFPGLVDTVKILKALSNQTSTVFSNWGNRCSAKSRVRLEFGLAHQAAHCPHHIGRLKSVDRRCWFIATVHHTVLTLRIAAGPPVVFPGSVC